MVSTPQFGTAEYSTSSGSNTCKSCHQSISGSYYRVKDAMLCGNCAGRLQSQIPQDSHGAFARGVMFGLGGFVLGLILYAGFTMLTGIEIGFVALAVGWIVGKAIMIGSRGVGGRRYQIAAVLLTYAAVSMAFVPILIHYMRANPEKFTGEKTQKSQPVTQKSSAEPAASQTETAATAEPANESGSQPASDTKPKVNFAAAIGTLALMGLASPFMQLSSGYSGIIGLVILFVGMQFAWKITRGIQLAIEGPFQASASGKA